MEYWKMKTLLMVAFLGLSRVNSRLTVTPSDAKVVNGTWVTLNCSTDSKSPIVWVKGDDWGFYRKTVFDGSKIAAEFNTSYTISRPKQGSFNLEFLATEETASVYRCKNGRDSASAKLDIIKSAGQPTMPDLESILHDFFRNNQRHDERHIDHGPPYVPNERSLQNIAEHHPRYNNHGRNTEPKTGPDDTALIAGILGTIMVLATVVKCCC